MTREKVLSRTEATLVAGWLRDQEKDVPQGWLTVWKLTPAQVAEKFDVEASDVEVAARRVIGE